MKSYAMREIPKELMELLFNGLSTDEVIVLAYLMKEWSVGEIQILKDLKDVCKGSECLRIFKSLIEKGLVKYVIGCCYNVNAEAVAKLLNLQNVRDVRKVGKSLVKFLSEWYDLPP